MNDDIMVTVPLSEVHVVPLPCVRDEHGDTREQTIKALLAKVDEELNELKAAITYSDGLYMCSDDCAKMLEEKKNDGLADLEEIANEAADVITSITTMLEAIGIGEAAREAAQNRVNEKNRNRGRL